MAARCDVCDYHLEQDGDGNFICLACEVRKAQHERDEWKKHAVQQAAKECLARENAEKLAEALRDWTDKTEHGFAAFEVKKIIEAALAADEASKKETT